MNYARYFKTDQKVFLINMSPERRHDLYESVTGVIVQCGENLFDIVFPYLSHEGVVFPFKEGMFFKLTSETFGVGVQLSVRFEGFRPDGSCRFSPTGNLELFQRRQIPRFDLSLPMCALPTNLAPGELHDEWEQMVSSSRSGAFLEGELVRQSLNLSAGGIRFDANRKVTSSDLHLLRIDLEDGAPPVCAVSEVVWTRSEGKSHLCGNRFIRILKSDQQRLVKLITDLLVTQGKNVASFSSNWELLDKMIFSDM